MTSDEREELRVIVEEWRAKAGEEWASLAQHVAAHGCATMPVRHGGQFHLDMTNP